MKYLTKSAEETKQLAKKIAHKFSGGVIALEGELGAGKTTFTQGFAQGLGIKEKIISPTFVLIRQHQIPKLKRTLYHIDLYRLDSEKDLKSLGLEELWSNKENIILIEWAQKAKKFLPKNTIKISVQIKKKNIREITID